MYSVSDDYKIKMLDQVQTHTLSGTIDQTAFTGDDVIGVSYSNRCSDKSVSLGSVNIGVLKLTFLTDILNRGNYYGKKITLSDSLLLGYDDDEEPIWESVPIGQFYVAEATWRAEGMIDIVAYDCLSKLDDNLELDTSTGTIYSFCKYIETETGVEFGLTQEECALLPNGTETISPYEQNDMTTYRDLVSALAQMVGGFATATRDGKWVLKTFGSSSVVTIPKNRRLSGAKYSDYTTLYDAISYVKVDEDALIVVGTASGLIMKLGSNPFLQLGTGDAITRRAEAIVSAILPMVYTPFSASMLPALVCLDLGDVISFTDDYTENTSLGAVMDLAWTFNKSFQVVCYGDNPNLRNGQSKTDKNISGLQRQTTQNEVTYYTYANVEALTFGSEVEVPIARLAFTSAQKTTVKIMHEFIMDMLADLSESCSYEIRYYLDNELRTYKPYERVNGFYGAESGETELSICRDFFYILKDVDPGIRHTWEVRIITHGIETTTIDVNNAHVTLEGQRLYGEEHFDGLVEAYDTLSVIPLGNIDLVDIGDLPDFVFKEVVLPQASDNLVLLDVPTMTETSMTDSLQIFCESLKLKLLTESGDQRVTENGNRRITE